MGAIAERLVLGMTTATERSARVLPDQMTTGAFDAQLAPDKQRAVWTGVDSGFFGGEIHSFLEIPYPLPGLLRKG